MPPTGEKPVYCVSTRSHRANARNRPWPCLPGINALVAPGLVLVHFLRATEMTEAGLSIGHGDAQTVIDNIYGVDQAKDVAVEAHPYVGRVGIDTVPTSPKIGLRAFAMRSI
jgi:hypothetical protein